MSSFYVNFKGQLTHCETGQAEELIIPSGAGIKSIHAFLFCKNPYLKKVVIPEGVERIEDEAFCHCKSLEQVILPVSLKTIGAKAFAGCENLRDINLQNVSHLGDKAFSDATALVDVDFRALRTTGYLPMSETGWELRQASKNTMIIAGNVLLGLTSKIDKKVTIPKEVSFIAPCIFDAIEITTVTFLNTDTVLGERAFIYSDLKKINLPNIKEIPPECFFACIRMESISFPQTLQTIRANAFAHCSQLKTLHIPESITRIETEAFHLCCSLESLSFAPRKTPLYIGENAFAECPALRSVKLPKGIRYMPRTKTPYKIFDDHVDIC